jgi:hypothetical protein
MRGFGGFRLTSDLTAVLTALVLFVQSSRAVSFDITYDSTVPRVQPLRRQPKQASRHWIFKMS